MSPARRRLLALTAALGLGLSHAGGSAEGRTVLTLRTSPEVADCVRRALAGGGLGRGLDVQIEIGDPRATDGADLVIGEESALTRVLESGRADDRSAAPIGVHTTARGGVRRWIAAPVGRSAHFDEARAVVAALAGDAARATFAQCAGLPAGPTFGVKADAFIPGSGRFAVAVMDWWMPACSLKGNAFTDPKQALGPPDAENTGPRGSAQYRGMISLGQGGYLVLDMGQTVVNHTGPDVRVYQFTSNEPVTLYGGDSPNGPFTLIAWRRVCGDRGPDFPANWGYCDFDLAEGGLSSARYLKVEDGEYYPCLLGDTTSEGADIDAVELINP